MSRGCFACRGYPDTSRGVCLPCNNTGRIVDLDTDVTPLVERIAVLEAERTKTRERLVSLEQGFVAHCALYHAGDQWCAPEEQRNAWRKTFNESINKIREIELTEIDRERGSVNDYLVSNSDIVSFVVPRSNPVTTDDALKRIERLELLIVATVSKMDVRFLSRADEIRDAICDVNNPALKGGAFDQRTNRMPTSLRSSAPPHFDTCLPLWGSLSPAAYGGFTGPLGLHLRATVLQGGSSVPRMRMLRYLFSTRHDCDGKRRTSCQRTVPRPNRVTLASVPLAAVQLKA